MVVFLIPPTTNQLQDEIYMSVLPLDFASKDVKNSSLLSDTLEEQDNMTETLQKMEVNRDENLKLLKQKKSLIIKQISAAKSKVDMS
jgi:hypothetical protein